MSSISICSEVIDKHSVPSQSILLNTLADTEMTRARASAEKFSGGPTRIEPVLTSKNGKIFEIWEL